jgi:hypothetical protein
LMDAEGIDASPLLTPELEVGPTPSSTDSETETS